MSLQQLREKTREIAGGIAAPVFYADKADEIARSEYIASHSLLAGFSRDIIKGKGGAAGHGYGHAHSVASDAAAIVYCEAGFNGRSDRLAENGMIAGYLHDIMRDESDHPRKGAQYAANRLKGLMSDYDLEMIVFAIKNHEAFREFDVVPNADYMLLSNALYDADKFRWGPDNFVYTLWDMAESMNINPDFIIKNYDRAIEGIVRVRETFRTATGKRYGPDFIDKGLEIGRALYKFCTMYA